MSVQQLTNHLWQSTLFAAAVWLLSVLLRHHRAEVRYKLWLAASLKFLVPFALLVTIGRQFEWPAGPAPSAAVVQPISQIVDGMGQPFFRATRVEDGRKGPLLPWVAPAVWLCGVLFVGISWTRRWRAVQEAVRRARPVEAGLGIPVMTTPGRMEPGVAGILRPVLLLPEGITERLTAPELGAVMAHEMCHVRRRDNLAVAMHAVVESLFWFHPLVWWIRERMMEERERACDEEVVRRGGEPAAYAEGILKVCRFYLESPACVAGVTGADLKKRIEEIMSRRLAKELDMGKRLLLVAAAAMAIAAPLLVGLLHVPEMRAQNGGPAKFEVASVKENNSPDVRGGNFQTQPGGRLTVTNIPLYAMITWVYGVPMQSMRMSGGPSWIRSTHYDIEARAAEGAIPVDLPGRVREDRMRPMLQALLAERFHLVVRTEHKEMPVYLVTVAKGGIKMEKANIEEKDCGPDVPCHFFNGGQGRGVHGKAANMEDLVHFVENWSDRPMLDRTELKGLYNMDSDGWVPMRGPGGGNEGLDDPVRPTLFMVFERQLGLKVEQGKATVETYVIEHVEKPTGN